MKNENIIEKNKKYLNEIYSIYNNEVYVPMSEARNLYLPVTVGCSYNKCLYCGLSKNTKFKILSLEEIEENLKKLKFINNQSNRKIKKVNLLGGNPLVLDTNYLIKISKLVFEYFKDVEYISCFSRAEDIYKKSIDDLKLLKQYGYNNFSIGIESGLDIALKLQKKNESFKSNLMAMKKLEEIKINYSVYIILGFGGVKYSKENALETSKLLNRVNPFEIIVVNLVYFKNAPLIELVKNKEFKRLSPLESLKEEYLLLSNLNMENTLFNGTHKNNIISIKGKLPEHKDILLKEIKINIDKYSNFK